MLIGQVKTSCVRTSGMGWLENYGRAANETPATREITMEYIGMGKC